MRRRSFFKLGLLGACTVAAGGAVYRLARGAGCHRAAGWQVTDAFTLQLDRRLEADVVIIGSGAGGGITAGLLARAGLKVLMVEEGGLKSSQDFKMREAHAYPALYQESAARKTRDKAINILQGRTVGGSTTVNWTSSFRTPPGTLAHWQRHHGLAGYTEVSMAPWFELVERRLHISDWPVPPNENNDLLRRGARVLGISTAAIRRNVNGCWNLGYCGMGCPTNAKQSMLVTTIPAALQLGARLVTHARAERFVVQGERIASLHVTALDAAGQAPTGIRLSLLAMAEIQVAAGARSVYPVHEMGGCAMSDDERLGVCDAQGRYRGLANLSVHDGSLFPTSIGANPQLSIYALAARLDSGLAQELTGQPAPGFGAGMAIAMAAPA